jgi:O-antigen ligase
MAAIALVVEAPSVERFELVFLGALAAFVVWVAASAFWSEATPALRELERDLAYVAVPLAAFAVLRRATVPALLGGLTAGIGLLSLYSLATRLFPDRIGSYDPVAVYRLSTPIGYWNALGIFSALGIVLALGFVARSASWVVRAAAAAELVVLAPALFFTYSRGSWLALGIALVALLAYDPARLQAAAAILIAAVVPAVAVWLSSREDALTRQRAALSDAAHDGHRLALVLLVLAVVAAGVGAGLALVSARVSPPRAVRFGFAGALGAAAVAAVVVVVAAYGGPQHIASRAWDSFSAPPPKVGTNLNARLFSFSGNGRADLWRSSWRDAKAHPAAGTGAGSFEEDWLRERKIGLKVRDAHSLYIEALGELGVVGLVLLVAALAVPLVAAFRVRARPLAPFAFAAYVAFLVHAGVDWDWEVPAVVLTALLAGCALIVWARDEEEPAGPALRYGLLGGAVAVMVVAFAGLVGNLALTRAGNAARDGDWARSLAQAKRAHTWAPWSSEPLQRAGEARLGLGRLRDARASFRHAIDRSPGDWELWFDLTRASEGAAQRRALARAKRLNPLGPEIAELEHELATQGSIGVVRK